LRTFARKPVSSLTDPGALISLKGISDKRASLFAKLGVERVFDLFFLYPRLYEDWSETVSGADLLDGEVQVFQAMVARSPSVSRYGKRSTVRTELLADQVTVRAIWFNQPWLADALAAGETYLFRGLILRKGTRLEINSPQFYRVGSELPPLLPIYPLTAGLKQTVVREAVKAAMAEQALLPLECLPKSIRLKRHLAERTFALAAIHFPADRHALMLARDRLKYEELFLAKLALSYMTKRRLEAAVPPPLDTGGEKRRQVHAWLSALPFGLTRTQKRSVDELLDGLDGRVPMHRLLQGDVGSGKTVVAAAAVLYAKLAGGQSAFLAPTAVLAAQHYRTLNALFAKTGMNSALLTGHMPAKERRKVLAGLADGSVDCVVGTHAILEPTVTFSNLAFAVTDEQHRFGVLQRQRLLKTADDVRPHLLVMSATPIPRTLALIVYGDLDVSVISEMPPGRAEIKTYPARSADRPRIETIMAETMARGEQIYVVCPLIDQSELIDLKAASQVQALLQARFPDRTVALLHGSQRPSEKDRTMLAFAAGDVDILVSTTVIEVGIDHPNATMMVVENAERFGLAQLHQLRGRVGRGDRPGLCILISDTQDQDAKRRLLTLCKNRDGFALAEADLLQRGPGDFFGTRQHGLPEFRLVNLYEEKDLIDQVSADVADILKDDPELLSAENRRLLPAIGERFGDHFMHLVL